MRLLFIVTGFGFGDTIRSSLLIDEFLKRNPKTEVMILGYDFSYDFFKKKFLTLKFSSYKFPDKGLEFKTHRFLIKNYRLPFSWLRTYLKYKNKIKKFDPDFIISDFEPISNFLAKRLKKKCISIFGFDPKKYKRYNKKNEVLDLQARFIQKVYHFSDKVIVTSYDKNKDYDNIHYVSPIVRNINLKDEESLMRELGLGKRPVIVMLGGSDFGLDLGREIIKLKDEFNEEFIIFGGKKQIPGYHLTKFREDYLKYLKVSKAVITLAGRLTLNECLLLGKPTMIYPIKNHVEQLMNAYALKKYTFVRENLDNVKQDLGKFLGNLNFYSKKMKEHKIKSNGIKETVDYIYSLMGES